MPAYLDFVVSLQDVLPRPWRRFLLPASASFAALHEAIQEACGWTQSHLYEFRESGAYEIQPIAALAVDEQWDDEKPVPDAARVKLPSHFGPGRATSCIYLYDFGDGWTHDVQLYEVVQRRERFRRRLVAGEHPFPPDDTGGPDRYAELQEALRTGKDPEGLLEWARETWGWTGEFDLERVRARFEP